MQGFPHSAFRTCTLANVPISLSDISLGDERTTNGWSNEEMLKAHVPHSNVGNSYFKFSYMFSFVNFNFFSKVKNQS